MGVTANPYGVLTFLAPYNNLKVAPGKTLLLFCID
jgi:hypothetical protein